MDYTQRISRIRVGAQVVSPRSVFLYVTEGESRRATPPKQTSRRVYLVIGCFSHNLQKFHILRLIAYGHSYGIWKA